MLNFTYILVYTDILGVYRETSFTGATARAIFIDGNADLIKHGECYVDRLDGNGKVYQFSFSGRNEWVDRSK